MSVSFLLAEDSSKMSTKVCCAWCGDFMSGDPTAVVVSHGICLGCAKIANADARQMRRLESLIKTGEATARNELNDAIVESPEGSLNKGN